MSLNKVPAAMLSPTRVTKTASYTLIAEDSTVGFDCTSADCTATLPAAASNSGRKFLIRKTDTSSHILTITGANGGTDIKLCYQNEGAEVMSDGTNWQIVSKNIPQKLISASAFTQNYSITANQWGDITSVSLTPGKWRSRYYMEINNNGATTFGRASIGISTTSGNSTTGLTLGDTESFVIGNGTTGKRVPFSPIIACFTVTSTTTYYIKAAVEDSITNVQYSYSAYFEKVDF